MNFYISNLLYHPFQGSSMAALPSDIGLEIFSETGSDFYWNQLLPELLKDRRVPLSVHGPFQRMDISNPYKDFSEMKDEYERTFKLCMRFGAHNCVCHPYWGVRPENDTPEELKKARECSLERMLRLNELAEQYAVTLLIENLPETNGMLDMNSFLELFGSRSELSILIDVGHAFCQHWDLDCALSALGSRIKAFHIHDNNGDFDSHFIVGNGKINWDSFFDCYLKYTPGANLVCEYVGTTLECAVNSVRDIQRRLSAAALGIH